MMETWITDFKAIVHRHLERCDRYVDRGLRRENAGKFAEAIDCYTCALRFNPRSTTAIVNRALSKCQLKRFREAVQDFDIATQLSPEDDEIFLHRGMAKEELGCHAEAIADFERAVELNPTDDEALLHSAMAKEHLGRYGDAIRDYDRAIELNPGDETSYINRALAKKQLGQLQQALNDLNIAIRLNSNDDTALINRGVVRYELGRFEAAVADFTKAVDIDPNNAEPYYNRALSLKELGRHDEALRELGKALTLDPNDDAAYFHRGLIKQELLMIEEAIQDYSAAIRIDPSKTVSYVNLGLAHEELCMHEQALEDYAIALELNPNDARTRCYRGLCKYELGKYEEAVAEYDLAAMVEPHNPQIYNYRGLSKFELGKYSTAISDFTRAIDYGAPTTAYGNRAACRREQGDFVRALSDYVVAISLDSSNNVWYIDRGNVLCTLGRYHEALRDFDAAIELDPMDGTPFKMKAECFVCLGQFDAALKMLTRAIIVEPDAEFFFSRAYCYGAMDMWAPAVQVLNTAIEITPEDRSHAIGKMLLLKTVALIRLRRFDEAESVYKESATRKPAETGELIDRIGSCNALSALVKTDILQARGQWDQAHDSLVHAVEDYDTLLRLCRLSNLLMFEAAVYVRTLCGKLFQHLLPRSSTPMLRKDQWLGALERIHVWRELVPAKLVESLQPTTESLSAVANQLEHSPAHRTPMYQLWPWAGYFGQVSDVLCECRLVLTAISLLTYNLHPNATTQTQLEDVTASAHAAIRADGDVDLRLSLLIAHCLNLLGNPEEASSLARTAVHTYVCRSPNSQTDSTRVHNLALVFGLDPGITVHDASPLVVRPQHSSSATSSTGSSLSKYSTSAVTSGNSSSNSSSNNSSNYARTTSSSSSSSSDGPVRAQPQPVSHEYSNQQFYDDASSTQHGQSRRSNTSAAFPTGHVQYRSVADMEPTAAIISSTSTAAAIAASEAEETDAFLASLSPVTPPLELSSSPGGSSPTHTPITTYADVACKTKMPGVGSKRKRSSDNTASRAKKRRTRSPPTPTTSS